MKPQRAWPKLMSIWMNATADAYSMGEASWAYDDQGSPTIRLWVEVFERTCDEMKASEAVRDFATERGIDPKRHKIRLERH